MRRAFVERDAARGLYATLVWLVEEVGELASSILEGRVESVEEEVADVVAWVFSVASMLGVDVEAALRKKYGRELGCP